MRHRFRVAVGLSAMLCVTGSVAAQALGSAFTYQGELKESGEAQTQAYDLQFCLFDSPDQQNALVPLDCEPIFVAHPVENGRFTVTLDFGEVFAGQTRYLEVRVGPANAGATATLSPRQPIRPTPEALRAATAATAATVPWSGVANIPAGFADGEDADSGVTSIATGTGLSGGPITSSGTIAIADGGVGPTQIAPGAVGAAQIDSTQVQRRIATACTAGSTIVAIAENGSITCAAGPRRHFTSSNPSTGPAAGSDLSVALRSDGIALVPHYQGTGANLGQLQVHLCANSYCSFGNPRVVDASGNVGWESSIAIRSDQRAVIAYHDIANRALKLAICANANCTGSASVVTLVDHATDIVGFYIDLKLGVGNIPILSYARFSPDFSSGSVEYLRCSNADCNGLQSPVTLSTARVRSFTGLELALAGTRPTVVFDRDGASPTIEAILCADLGCASHNGGLVLKTLGPGPAGQGAGVALSTSSSPVISYYDGENGDLRVLTCLNPGCVPATAMVDVAALSVGNVGWRSDIVMPANALPVLAFYDVTRASYGIARCLDTYCSSLEAPLYPVASSWASQVGGENTLALTLDAEDHPFGAFTRLTATTTRFNTVKCESQDCR